MVRWLIGWCVGGRVVRGTLDEGLLAWLVCCCCRVGGGGGGELASLARPSRAFLCFAAQRTDGEMHNGQTRQSGEGLVFGQETTWRQQASSPTIDIDWYMDILVFWGFFFCFREKTGGLVGIVTQPAHSQPASQPTNAAPTAASPQCLPACLPSPSPSSSPSPSPPPNKPSLTTT